MIAIKLNRGAIGKLCFIAVLLLLACVLVLCCFYLFTGYYHLTAWYLNLNNCFYRSQSWSKDFFTPGIKSDGNIYSIIGIVTSAAGLIYIAKRLKSARIEDWQPIKFGI